MKTFCEILGWGFIAGCLSFVAIVMLSAFFTEMGDYVLTKLALVGFSSGLLGLYLHSLSQEG